MAKQSQAWLLTPLGLPSCVVALHEVMHYVSEFRPLPVPFTPAHCATAMVWQEQIVPVLNLGILTGDAYSANFKLVVLAYQTEPLTPLKLIALAVREAPERILVSDETACDLPETNPELWQFLAKSCVTYQETPTPIINVAMLDSVELRRYAEHTFAELKPELQLTWMSTATMSKAPIKPALSQNVINLHSYYDKDDNDLDDLDDQLDDDLDDQLDDDLSDNEWDELDDIDEEDFDFDDDDLDDDIADDFSSDLGDDSDWDDDDFDDEEDFDFDDEDLDDDIADDEDLDDEDLDDESLAEFDDLDDWDDDDLGEFDDDSDLDDDEFDLDEFDEEKPKPMRRSKSSAAV